MTLAIVVKFCKLLLEINRKIRLRPNLGRLSCANICVGFELWLWALLASGFERHVLRRDSFFFCLFLSVGDIGF